MATARFDRGSLARPLEGTLYEAVVARTHRDGDALKYPTGPEYRDVDELDHIVSQLPGLPLIAGYTSTLGHPTGLLKDGAAGRVIGKIVAARRDGDEAIASIMVADADALEQIREGISEVSLGYECELDGRRMQRATHLDHISIVPRGRCTGPGGRCALRIDGADDTGCTCGTVVDDAHVDAVLTAAARHRIPGHLFADPAHQGLPIEDEAHVRAAMSRFDQEHFASSSAKAAGYHHILARAKTLGVDATGFEKAHGGHLDEAPAPCGCQHPGTTLADSQGVGHPATHMPDLVASENKDQAELQTKFDQVTADLRVATARADAAELERDNARADAAKFSKEIDAAKALTEQAVADAAKTKLDAETEIAATKAQAKLDADDAFNAEMGARIALFAEVVEIVGKDSVKPTDDQRTMKVALVKHVDGVEIDEKKSDEYVAGMYAGALRRAAGATESRAELREATQQMRTDGAAAVAKSATEREADAKKAASDRASAAWQRKSN